MTTPSELAEEYRYQALSFKMRISVDQLDDTGFASTLVNRFCVRAAAAGYDVRCYANERDSSFVIMGDLHPKL